MARAATGQGEEVRALLLDSSIQDPPVQGRLRLEAVVLRVHLWLGLCHLLQTLPGNEGRECVSHGTAGAQQRQRVGTPDPSFRSGPSYRARGWCMWQEVVFQHHWAIHRKTLQVVFALVLPTAQQLLLSEIRGSPL